MFARTPLLALAVATLTACTVEPEDDGLDRAAGCIEITNFHGNTVPPAGLAMGFRVLGCDGRAVRPLTAGDVSLINGETGRDFNDSSEGGGRTVPGTPDNVRVYAMLALDFSGSIFDNDAQQDVVDGALAFIQSALTGPGSDLDHQIALVAFGAPDQVELIAPFTDDQETLEEALQAALAAGSRGTTDLYGAYTFAMQELQAQGQTQEADGDIVERIGVVMTDGTHEAGDEVNRRAMAMEAKNALDGHVYSIGVQGDYDESALQELASFEEGFLSVGDPDQLEAAFQDVSGRAEALARSNYVVGICTPVALGVGSVELRIEVDGASETVNATYPTEGLDGSVDACDPEEVASQLGEGESTSTGDDDDAPNPDEEVSGAEGFFEWRWEFGSEAQNELDYDDCSRTIEFRQVEGRIEPGCPSCVAVMRMDSVDVDADCHPDTGVDEEPWSGLQFGVSSDGGLYNWSYTDDEWQLYLEEGFLGGNLYSADSGWRNSEFTVDNDDYSYAWRVEVQLTWDAQP